MEQVAASAFFTDPAAAGTFGPESTELWGSTTMRRLSLHALPRPPFGADPHWLYLHSRQFAAIRVFAWGWGIMSCPSSASALQTGFSGLFASNDRFSRTFA